MSWRISKHFINTSRVIWMSKIPYLLHCEKNTTSVIPTQKTTHEVQRNKIHVFWVVWRITGLLKGVQVSMYNLSVIWPRGPSDEEDFQLAVPVSPFWPITHWRQCFIFVLACTFCYAPAFGIVTKLNFSLCALYDLFGKPLKLYSTSPMKKFYMCSV